MVKYWIQHSDFQSEELGDISPKDAIRAFQNHDWNDEKAKFKEMEKLGKENCPPGMGFNADGVGILHVCPGENGKALCFFHEHRQIKIFGILPWTLNRNYELRDVPASAIPDLITALFEGNLDKIRKPIS